jgi:cyanophycinase
MHNLKISTFRIAVTIFVVAISFLSSFAQQRLVIVGGGGRPEAAMSKFVNWAGNTKAHILVIPWATEEPESSFESLKEDLSKFNVQVIELAPIAPITEQKKEQLLTQIKNATGIFFTGGDQVRIMNVLKDQPLATILKERYSAGVVFGGTSAGTAIMSRRMITGEGDFTVIDGHKVETSSGLGLLPDPIIVDQHFIKRQRQNRLFGLVLQDKRSFGVGIDENTALLIENNRYAEVSGKSQVMTVGQNKDGSLVVRLFQPGETLDLFSRKLTTRPSSNR